MTVASVRCTCRGGLPAALGSDLPDGGRDREGRAWGTRRAPGCWGPLRSFGRPGSSQAARRTCWAPPLPARPLHVVQRGTHPRPSPWGWRCRSIGTTQNWCAETQFYQLRILGISSESERALIQAALRASGGRERSSVLPPAGSEGAGCAPPEGSGCGVRTQTCLPAPLPSFLLHSSQSHPQPWALRPVPWGSLRWRNPHAPPSFLGSGLTLGHCWWAGPPWGGYSSGLADQSGC